MTSSDATGSSARYRTLLIPTDLTAASDRILGRVALLPLAPKARLTLLHVVPKGLPARTQNRAKRDAMKFLKADARHLARSLPRNVSIRSVVAVGAAAGQIASHGAATNAELIVMGRGGGRTLREMFLGSTAERVIRHGKLPVLVVRLPPRAPYRNPALAVDIDDAAAGAVSQLLKLIPAPRPQVTVVHAYEELYGGRIYANLSRDDAEEYRDSCRQKATQRIAKLLDTIQASAKLPGADVPVWKTHVRLGSPKFIIPGVVKQTDADLLVMGTNGHAGLSHALLGTIAGNVMRTVRCDVLIVPPPLLQASE
ncbi:MAG: universal stress protein [Gemmatimonadales bacterium]